VKSLNLQIYSPSQTLLNETDVSEVLIPANWGQMGILPGHTDYITTLTKGVITYKISDSEKSHEIDGGFFEVKKNKATILVSN
jgi:F-type H+-transporting ATPase subunit epsilon